MIKLKKRGQVTTANLPYALVTLILLAVLYTPLKDIVVTPFENVTGAVGMVIALYPLFWWLGGLMLLLLIMMPVRQQ
jgi:hypothetical protein